MSVLMDGSTDSSASKKEPFLTSVKTNVINNAQR